MDKQINESIEKKINDNDFKNNYMILEIYLTNNFNKNYVLAERWIFHFKKRVKKIRIPE